MGRPHDMRPLIISGNELRAQAVKAARGLGFDWGRAKYVGEGVLRAERHGLNGLEGFLSLRDNLNTGLSSLTPTMLQSGGSIKTNAVDLGIAMADGLALMKFHTPGSFIVSGCPLFLGILCYGLTGSTRALHVVVGETPYLVQDNFIMPLVKKPQKIGQQQSCYISECTPTNDVCEPLGRFALDEDQAKLLEQFASRVYAPATEISRLSGAGAGLQDND